MKIYLLLNLFLFLCPFTEVSALSHTEFEMDGSFHVVDFTSNEDFGAYANYVDALREYTRRTNEEGRAEGNLGIIKDGIIHQVENGIIAIKTADDCSTSITFVNDVDETENSVNGCYGVDAAYLNTDSSGNKVKFMQAGVVGWANLEDVEIYPIEDITTRLTMYTSDQGILYHEINGNMEEDNYISIINSGKTPDYLKDGETYYSYDGHYFYSTDDLHLLLEDYRYGTRENSINPEEPYYNYYQYLPHRSLTSATQEDVEKYFYEVMGITGPIDHYRDDDKDTMDDTLTRSQYYGVLPAFFQYQYEYGANALMMLSLSASESGYGHSSLSYTRNNLFGHAAYDSEEEANASRFLDINNSIYSHAKYYISGSFASPLKAQYHGSFFGNQSAGMNVSYSDDPYWGEKAASYYGNLDQLMGEKDYNHYQIGIKTSNDSIYVYQSPETNAKVFYNSGKNPDQAYLILEAFENDFGSWYKIQSDATLNENAQVDLSYKYDFKNDVGYVKQSDLQVLIGSDTPVSNDYVTVTFDGAGGTFPGAEEVVTYDLPSGSKPSIIIPKKENALFTGWDKEINSITSDTTYRANYKDVDAIEMLTLPNQEYEVNDRIILQDGTIRIYFSDGTTEDVALTSSMVSGFSFDEEGEQEVIVSYAGAKTSYPIHISKEADQTRTGLKNRIVQAIEKYEGKDALTDKDKEELLKLKTDIDAAVVPYLTQAQLRSFDTILKKSFEDKIRYVIEPNTYQLGISGLSTSVPLEDSLQKHPLLADTYRVKIHPGVTDVANEALIQKNEFLENQIFDTFTITLQKNFDVFRLDGPVLFSIHKPVDDTEGEVYTVLYYDEVDGDVEKCYTRQSDHTITFLGNKDGQYMLIGRRTSNTYSSEDPVESVNEANRSFDLEYAYVYTFVTLVVLLVLWYLIHKLRKKKKVERVAKERIEKNERKKNEPLPPVDVTQVMEKFDTEVLSRKEILLAEKEANDREFDRLRKEAKAKMAKKKYQNNYVENSSEKDEALKVLSNLNKKEPESDQ